VAYLRVRTPAMIREAETRFRQFDAVLGPDRDSITYRTGPPDRVPDTFVMSKERSDVVSTQRDIETRRNDVLKLPVGAGMQLAGALLLLEWTILTAPDGRSFVIGDNPFSIVPSKSHDVNLEGIGPMTPGAAVFVPLSSRICLRMKNTGNPPTASRKIGGSEVRAINSCQVLNSERYLFGQSDVLLKRLVADARGLNLGEVLLREAPSVSNESRSILHSFTKSKIGPEWSCRVPMD